MEATQRNYLTIVSGLPRSGTSMMMQMLDKGGIPALVDNIRKADEDNPKGYYEFEPVKKTKEDASWLDGSEGKVVKMVNQLLLDLPLDHEYRVVFMRRDLAETVKSQNIMLERHGKETGDLPADKLIQIFKAQMAKVDEHLTGQANFKVLYVNYNEVLRNPAPQIAAINDFLDGTLDTEAMMAVVDPSLYRNRNT